MTLFAVQRLTSVVAVHSAVFAHDGRAIVVPAASGGGKSTLTMAAADADVKVLTDEYALIDQTTGRRWTGTARECVRGCAGWRARSRPP